MTASVSRPVVLAIGHAFPDLRVEEDALSNANVAVVDGNVTEKRTAVEKSVIGVLLGTSTRCDRETISRLPACKAIVRYGIGVDNVDLAAANEAGIVVCNVRDYCREEVADHALAMALALTRGLHVWNSRIHAGQWRSGARPVLHRSSTSVFGLIGFGQIGRVVARKASRIFGGVLVHDPLLDGPPADLDVNVQCVESIDELLSRSNIVSVHVPLTEQTRDLIDEHRIRLMPPGSCVVNVSRGGIVNEADVLEAVRDGHLLGAGFDSFTTEPIPPDDPLLQEQRVLLSPHVAWLSEEAAMELRRRASEEMARIVSGQRPVSPVGAVVA